MQKITTFLMFDGNAEAAMSFYEAEIDVLFEKLSEQGQVSMPLAQYPFSDKFGWLSDRYGVSWQLSLVKK